MLNLDEIRTVFPDWPSELDVAKAPGNWASRAQAFYCAARVLRDELEATHQEMHARVGQVLDETIYVRQQTQLPAEFCLAFCLELAIKAALVAQGKLEQLTTGEPLPFGNHMLHALAKEINGFETTPDEDQVLLWASEAVLNGKYPVRKRPSDSGNGVTVSRSLATLVDAVEPLYRRLMGIQSN